MPKGVFTLRMEGFVLTDVQWAKMEPHCLDKPEDPGRSGRNNRLIMEAVSWIVRTGSCWRDLPAMFGNWSKAAANALAESLAVKMEPFGMLFGPAASIPLRASRRLYGLLLPLMEPVVQLKFEARLVEPVPV